MEGTVLMNIYVDFDDCLCETARRFSGLAGELFGKDVPYEEIHYFDLQKSFGLTTEQYEELLAKGHEPEVLLNFEETPGASKVINEWIGKGHDVSIITGRPFRSYEVSRLWLDRHRLIDVRLYCMDKYSREKTFTNSGCCLRPDDYFKMKFNYAVEDSPEAFKFFNHLPELRVMVFDRPWNRRFKATSDNYRRCYDWESIGRIISSES